MLVTTLDQWLLQLNPSQASLSALVWIGFIFLCVFIWKNLWPFFIQSYWPHQVEMHKARVEERRQEAMMQASIQTTMRDALVEIKVLAAQQMLSQQGNQELLQKILAQQNSFYNYIDNARLQATAEMGKLFKQPEVKA